MSLFFFSSKVKCVWFVFNTRFFLLFFSSFLIYSVNVSQVYWALSFFSSRVNAFNLYSILNFIYSVFFSPLNCLVKKFCSLKALFFSSPSQCFKADVRCLRIKLIHRSLTNQLDPWATCGSTWSLTNLRINKIICGSHYHIRWSNRMSWVHKKYFKYIRGYFCLYT